MSPAPYPIVDVERFAQLIDHPAPVLAKTERMTVGQIAGGWVHRFFPRMQSILKRELELRRHDLQRSKHGAPVEYELWVWAGSQLLAFSGDQFIHAIIDESATDDTLDRCGRIVVREAARLLPALRADELASFERSVERPRIDLELIESSPLLALALFALNQQLERCTPPGALPRAALLRPALRSFSDGPAAVALGIVASMQIAELGISDAAGIEIERLLRPTARREISDSDARRLGRLLSRLPREWQLGVAEDDVTKARAVIHALQRATREVEQALAAARDTIERIGRAIGPRLDPRDWPVAIEAQAPVASAEELEDFARRVARCPRAGRGIELLQRALEPRKGIV